MSEEDDSTQLEGLLKGWKPDAGLLSNLSDELFSNGLLKTSEKLKTPVIPPATMISNKDLVDDFNLDTCDLTLESEKTA